MASFLDALPGNTGSRHGNDSPWVLFLVAAIFLAVGGLNAFRPELAFKLNARNYKNREAWEPSRQGLLVARATGSVGVVIGIVVLVIAFMKI